MREEVKYSLGVLNTLVWRVQIERLHYRGFLGMESTDRRGSTTEVSLV